MLDAAGKELSVGQIVAMTVSGYEDLKIGTIFGFTPKKVKVLWKYKKKGNDEVLTEDFLKFPYQVAVIEVPK